MKIILPVTWMMCGEIEVEADSIEDAIENFVPHDHELPENPEYVGDSFELSFDDVDAIKQLHPKKSKKKNK
jgi:hypothetical protein